MKSRLSVVVVGCVALVVGAVVGPNVAQAASAGLVHLEGGGSNHVAKVNSSGQLSVSDGTAHTKAGQLEATVASPGQAVRILGGSNCSPGGFYVVPAGKALIITTVVFSSRPTSAGTGELDLEIGAAATPCFNLVAQGISSGGDSLEQTFDPGIPVPSGAALGMFNSNDSAGGVLVYGYLVPSADVPAKIGSATPRKFAQRR